jgi:hypothetical protein
VLKYVTPAKPVFGRESDLIIHGEKLSAHTRLSPASVSLQENSISIQLIENRFTRTRNGPTLSRDQFMLLLNNVRAVYLRAKMDDAWYEVRLMRIELDQASPEPMSGNSSSSTSIVNLEQPAKQARLVERCSCPTGYTGSSCEVRIVF